MGSILGGILGGGSSAGQQAQMAGIKGSVGDYQTYRQEMAQALLNTLNQANSAYQGTNNALATLWGSPSRTTAPGTPAAHTPATPNVGPALPPPSGSPMGNAPRPNPADSWLTAGEAIMDPFFGRNKGVY